MPPDFGVAICPKTSVLWWIWDISLIFIYSAFSCCKDRMKTSKLFQCQNWNHKSSTYHLYPLKQFLTVLNCCISSLVFIVLPFSSLLWDWALLFTNKIPLKEKDCFDSMEPNKTVYQMFDGKIWSMFFPIEYAPLNLYTQNSMYLINMDDLLECFRYALQCT